MRWTTRELQYLEDHAQDGAEAIAQALGCSTKAVQWQAHTYGISLRRKWQCPRCGHWSYKPLNPKTGWCATCTKAERRTAIEDEVRQMREEEMREQEENRRRQALYAKKHRMKKKKANRKSIPQSTGETQEGEK